MRFTFWGQLGEKLGKKSDSSCYRCCCCCFLLVDAWCLIHGTFFRVDFLFFSFFSLILLFRGVCTCVEVVNAHTAASTWLKKDNSVRKCRCLEFSSETLALMS